MPGRGRDRRVKPSCKANETWPLASENRQQGGEAGPQEAYTVQARQVTRKLCGGPDEASNT